MIGNSDTINIISADDVSAVEVTAIDVQEAATAQQNVQKTADDDRNTNEKDEKAAASILGRAGWQLLDGLVKVSKIIK